MFKKRYNELTENQISDIIGLALDDDTSFDFICKKYCLMHGDVIKLMRKHITHRAFRNWRKRSSNALRNKKKHPLKYFGSI